MQTKEVFGQTQAAIVWFTAQGEKLAYQVKSALSERMQQQVQIQMGRRPGQSLKEWCREGFEQKQFLIFVGAVGIAVRSIAPFLKDKFTDPAVLVLDEQGRYVIPVLSGHVGGGNRWAAVLAEELSAISVITTATDLNGKFAVDVFASERNLTLTDRRMAKQISAEILAGETIGFFCEKKVGGSLPAELIQSESEEKEAENVPGEPAGPEKSRIYVGIHRHPDRTNTLYLHPKALVVGIGCRKGKTMEEIEGFVHKTLQNHQLAMESVCCLASLELKKEEPGILEFAGKYQIPFVTFSREELAEAPGDYTESGFVKEMTGIGNVCERAAVLAAENLSDISSRPESEEKAGRLILKKTAECGMTIALAEKEWSVEFE
ncbi:MAG: hypothetical protein HFH50_02845 [Lachnospiraceae bacterium]|jgi:cobalt-precorrin 5A hydrolase|nr:hypothetical protein [Lachnospiraceae bacterium]